LSKKKRKKGPDRRAKEEKEKSLIPSAVPAGPNRIESFLDRFPWLPPLSLFSVSFVFRLYFMNEGLFHHDEIWIAKAVERLFGKSELIGAVNGRYGTVFLNAVLYGPYRFLTGGTAEKVVPFTAIVTGALLVTTVYFLVREFVEDRLSAFLAGLFLNFNFLFLTQSTTGKENVPNALFAAIAILLFVRGAKRNSLALKIFGFASLSFSLTVHEAGIPLIPVFLAFLILFDGTYAKDWKTPLLDLTIALLFVAAPFLLYLDKVFFRYLTVRSSDTAFFEGLITPVLGIATGHLVRICGLPLLALAAAGIAAVAKNWKVLFPLTLWTLLLFYYGNLSGYVARYLLYVVIPIAVLAGIGSGALLRRLKGTEWKLAGAAVIGFMVCAHGIYNAYPLIHFRKDYCGPKRMALYVRAATEPDAVVVTMDENVHIAYYAGRDVLSHPVADYEQNRDFVGNVRGMALAGKKVYVNLTAFSYDPQGHFQRLMLENFRFLPVGEVLDEDYHRPELSFTRFQNRLFRIIPK
jgi:hypothetical protein